MLKSGISVALLAYREEENLRILIPQIIDILVELKEDYEVFVVDTEEPLDGTPSVCKEFGCRYLNQKYPHFGGAFKTAIEYAEYDKFLILDSDGSHPPEYIRYMYHKFIEEECDVVIGSRYVKGGITQDSHTSIVMSKVLNTVFRIALGINAHDISTDYRIYKTEHLKNVELENENYDILQEVLLKIKLNNGSLKIGEVPIVFKKRMFGKSKRKLIPFIISYIESLIKLICLRFPSLKNLFLYGIIGGVGAVIELAVFSILVYIGIMAEASNVAAMLCGFCFTFAMNTFFNFKKCTHLIKRFISYGTICLFGILFSSTCIYFLKGIVNLYLLKCILICVVAMVQFVLNKKITYRDTMEKDN